MWKTMTPTRTSQNPQWWTGAHVCLSPSTSIRPGMLHPGAAHHPVWDLYMLEEEMGQELGLLWAQVLPYPDTVSYNCPWSYPDLLNANIAAASLYLRLPNSEQTSLLPTKLWTIKGEEFWEMYPSLVKLTQYKITIDDSCQLGTHIHFF